MTAEQTSTTLRQLIADNQNKAAAELFYQWFEGKSASRQDAALALLNRIKALDKLLPIQRADFKGIFQAMAGLPVHGIEQWLDEVMLFADWYCPALGIEADRDGFRAAWEAALAPVESDGLPRVTVLRDFHAENIMLVAGKAGEVYNVGGWNEKTNFEVV